MENHENNFYQKLENGSVQFLKCGQYSATNRKGQSELFSTYVKALNFLSQY